MLSTPLSKSYINRCPGGGNPESRMGARPCGTEALSAPGVLRPGPAGRAPGRGQEEGHVQGRSMCREERQMSRLWRHIPNMRNPLLEQGTGLQRHTEQKTGRAGGGRLCFIFGFCQIKRIWEIVGTVVLNTASARLAQACF